MNLLALDFPSWIKPEIIPGLHFRWYALMYIIAFACTYKLFMRLNKKNELGFELSEDDSFSLFMYCILGLFLGARLVSTLLYSPELGYWSKPWLIFWPFRDGQFVGYQGMSYHGGIIGIVIGGFIFVRKKQLSFMRVADAACAAIPLGYSFGRLGNFINGELWGRVTTLPWGMRFPHAERFDRALPWVQDILTRTGDSTRNLIVNLPRHPSQLYEALFEGLVLWLILWCIIWKKKKYPGYVIASYMIGYGVIRFFIEYMREPDANLGYIISWGASSDVTAIFQSFLNISMGQILCAIMILAGVLIHLACGYRHRAKGYTDYYEGL